MPLPDPLRPARAPSATGWEGYTNTLLEVLQAANTPGAASQQGRGHAVAVKCLFFFAALLLCAFAR
jgi:hypothetical protein